MNDKERLNLIREGNRIYNDGDVALAQKYFVKANYKDGMLRVADYYFYDQKRPLNALPLYMKCGSKERIEEIYQRMAFALGKWIKEDKQEETPSDTPVEDSIIEDIETKSEKG